MRKLIASLVASVSLVCAASAASVTTGEELKAAIAAASETEPSVIEIGELDIYLLETVKLTKPITLRGAGIGKTVLRRDASISSMRMLELSNASASVENLTVTNGYLSSGTGAGAYVSAGTIRRCEFYNCRNQPWNTGWNQGGGVKLSGSNSKLIACVIRGVNVGDGQGEALWLESSAVAESCLICDNKCTTTGRADAYMVKVASATLRGCTIVNNYMGNSVALYNSNGTVKDCIVYGNKGEVATTGGLGNGFDIAGSTGSSSVINTLVTDPGFVDFANKNYALTAGPAIDAAQSGEATLALTTVDAAGNPRKTGSAVDIGALECLQAAPACSFIAKKTTVLENDPAILSLYAVGAGDAPEYTVSFGDGTAAVVTTETTVEHAYAHSGVYTVTVSVSGVPPKAGTITVKPKNLYVKEGGAGTAPYASEDQAAGYIEDVLAEAGDGSTIWLKKGNYTLKTTSPIEVNTRVTIRGATGRPEDVVITKKSGGTRPFTLSHASAVLADLTVTGGSPLKQNNHGSNVRITSAGGIVTNCIIRNGYNGQATTGGGGLAMAAGLVTHCVISNNYAYERGTGVFIEGGRLENCLICGNYGGADKGHHDDSGTVCVNGTCSIINCTIADNRAERCPSIYFLGGSNQKVINCLIFGNKSTAMTDSTIGVYYPSGKASLFTACAAPFKINDTCFTADDLKINAEYRPMAKSVCRDNATTSGITVPGTDLAGNPRLDEETGKLDIGCYEFHSSGLTASISSNPAMKDGAASGLTPYPITFMAEADGGVVTAYRWFVNGIEQTAETTATFATNITAAGTYQVTLKVSDGNQDYDADNAITVKTYPPVLYVDKASTNPVAPYETEATAATFLEDALAAAADGCEIRIAPETYPAKSGEITIGKGVTIRGMGATPADVVLDRKDASTSHRILTISHESSLVTGLTVSGGRRTLQGQYGGGVMITGRGGTISNCVVRNCGANGSDAGGGGIMLDVDNALATHCVVTNCTSSNDAPGNYSYVGGNGVCLYKGTVRDSLIAFCRQNNDSHGRKETWPDGAVAIYGGKMINCTVASNVNTTCSGVRAHGGKLINTIVSCNRLTTQDAAETAKVLAYGKAKTTTFDHCLADLDVDGKFAVEPAPTTFRSPGRGDFRLRSRSQAVDAGTVPADGLPAVDLRGDPRVFRKVVDFGCYESQAGGLTVLVK